jgi:hypothetical protein
LGQPFGRGAEWTIHCTDYIGLTSVPVAAAAARTRSMRVLAVSHAIGRTWPLTTSKCSQYKIYGMFVARKEDDDEDDKDDKKSAAIVWKNIKRMK